MASNKKHRRKHHKTVQKEQLNSPTKKTVSPELKAIKKRIYNLCEETKNEFKKSFYTHFHRRYLLAFAEFIDNPACYNKGLLGLYHCKSKIKPLQKRQRETLVKIVAALFTRLEVGSYQVGFCNNAEYMDTVAHTYKGESDNRLSIRKTYEKMWGESICEKRYYAAINHLKLADMFCSESIYRYTPNTDSQLSDDPEQEIPTIKSHASYKWFTHRFFKLFGIDEETDVKESRDQSIAKRIQNGWTTSWVSYSAFSDSFFSFFWSKKKKPNLKRGDDERYPQRQAPEWSIYGSDPCPDEWVHH